MLFRSFGLPLRQYCGPDQRLLSTRVLSCTKTTRSVCMREYHTDTISHSCHIRHPESHLIVWVKGVIPLPAGREIMQPQDESTKASPFKWNS